MLRELVITVYEDMSVTAVLDMDGEFHEEEYTVDTPEDLLKLIDKLEQETGLKASVVVVDRD